MNDLYRGQGECDLHRGQGECVTCMYVKVSV